MAHDQDIDSVRYLMSAIAAQYIVLQDWILSVINDPSGWFTAIKTSLSQLQNDHWVIIYAGLVLLAVYLSYLWVYIPCFRDFVITECCRVHLENKDSVKIGDTVVYAISGFITSSKSDLVAAKLTDKFCKGLTARITLGNNERIPAAKAYAEEETGKLQVVFVAKKSGNYTVELKHNGFILPGCPLYQTVSPDEMCTTQTVVELPSTPILLTDGMPQSIVVYPKDRTGFPCSHDGVRLDKFDFHASTEKCRYIFGKSCEIVGDRCRESLDASFTFENGYIRTSGGNHQLVIRLTLGIPNYTSSAYGIFEGHITYNDQPIKNGSFPIISLNADEYERLDKSLNEPKPTDVIQLKAIFLEPTVENVDDSIFRSLMLPRQDTLKANKEVYVNVSLKFICIKEVKWTVILSRTALFAIQGDTKINVVPETSDKIQYVVTLSDSSQNDIKLLMSASNTRMLMALYLKFRASVIGNAHSFSEKMDSFLEHLELHTLRVVSRHKDSFQLLKINRPDVLRTSYEATKRFGKEEWCNNFVVSFIGEPLMEDDSSWLEWSELLLDTMLENNPNGMFCSISDKSNYVHPNPSRNYRRWSIHYYELAGKVIGKYLIERSLNSKSLNYRVKARFSRSFLQQLLGVQPTAATLERDMPYLYETTLTALEKSTLEEGVVTFCVPVYDSYGKLEGMIPIIENGEKVLVTEDNMNLYLNALARHHLSSKTHREVSAFRAGFTSIIPEDQLLNFDENEFELLMCGWSKLDVKEMRKHNIIVGENWHPEIPRIVKWLWTTLTNMSQIDQAKFLQFSTGSSILPLGGFAQLSPPLTLSMTCLYGQIPTADPAAHTLCLSDHPNYDAFSTALLTAVRTTACCQARPKQCEHDDNNNNNSCPDLDMFTSDLKKQSISYMI